MIRCLIFIFKCLIVIGILVVALVAGLYWYYSKDLPTYRQLSEYRPPVISRIYAGNGALIGEFAKERRLFVPITSIPDKVKYAFIAAEDQNFYKHPGIDLKGIARAFYTNLINVASGKRMQGASTITQQVMKNFLLTHERKLERKIKEAILAVRFEETFSKEQILELYLNEIFLGARTYGLAAAAQAYFHKTPKDLTIAQAAYLACLPKGPNNYHPVRYKKRAVSRRNYVLRRMLEDKYITQDEYKEALDEPLLTFLQIEPKTMDASYFVEEVRRKLLERYGRSVLYNAGLTITSTIDPQLQKYAEQALREALISFDQKLGWRGPLARDNDITDPSLTLKKYNIPSDLYRWDIALVKKVDRATQLVNLYLKKEKKSIALPFKGNFWALRKNISAKHAIKQGDVLYVAKEKNAGKVKYLLRQIPQVNGALMVMDPHTGRVLAQQGGFTFSQSQFNRATQAKRQPGSAFKPFVYAAALEMGYSPATLVNDNAFTYRDALGRLWKPENYDHRYLGNVTMRTGLERSRNLMTIRIAKDIGIKNVINFAKRFGVGDGMRPFLPMALGAGEVTLEKMVTAYATFANGGKKVSPIYYDRIQDRHGKNIIIADIPLCTHCADSEKDVSDIKSEILLDPVTNYQMVSMLEGVVQRGTGRRLRSLGAPIAGKTGTTNDSKDAWFLGFTSNLVFGTYIGYDTPKPMGKRATGGGTAAPVIKAFLEKALKQVPARDFFVPKGVSFATVRKTTGEYIQSNNNNNIKSSTKSEKNKKVRKSNNIKEAFHSWQKPKKKWYKKKEFNPKKERHYNKPEHLKAVDQMINLGTGGLY